MNSIGILGAGTWGLALAKMLAETGKEVVVWSALEGEIEELKKTGRCSKLSDIVLPQNIQYTNSIEEVCANKDIIMFAVPSIFIRETSRKVKDYIKEDQIIVDVSKGIEADTFYTLTEVIADELKGKRVHLVTLSGPTHAEEVVRGLPTTIVAASHEHEVAESVQAFFASPYMRVYTNGDIRGVEICGALKNIIALATGMSDGLGYGDNAKAALITRGLAEVSRLGTKLGCEPETFSGLGCMGDMIVTCTSVHSRNHKCGYLIGQGVGVADAIKQVGMVVEGINVLPVAVSMAKTYEVEMPIIEMVNSIVNDGLHPKDAVDALLDRPLKRELGSGN